MSLTITVRPSGTTSGGENHELPSEGDNGNQEIDTRAEAEAALTYLPDGSTDTVVIGERSYTRDELIVIRDRVAADSETPEAPAASGTEMGDGPSHGFFLEGLYAGGVGDRGHSGGGVRAGYRGNITLSGGEHRFTLDPVIGLDVGHHSTGFMTPGGEAGTSSFTRYGGILGADIRYTPPVLEHRLWAAIGARFGVGGFGATGNTVALPTTCTPGEFGRGECEPDAGPRTGPDGLSGLLNYGSGGARGTDGAYVYIAGRLTVGGDIIRGDWGNLSVYGAFEPGYMHLLPSDGHAFGFATMAGLLGLSGAFGGNAVERPSAAEGPTRDSETIDATGTPVSLDTNADGTSAISLGADEIRDLADLPSGATIHGVALDGGTEDTTAPYEFEATSGEHTLSVRYSRPGETQERIRTVRIRVGAGEHITVPEGGTGEAYGMVLTMPSVATRPADDMVDGHAVAREIPLGAIQTTAEFPEGAMYTIYVDGNPVGEPAELPRDRTTNLALPATVGDGPHQVEIRVSRPNAAEIRYPARAVEVGPGTATLSAASVSAPSRGTYFLNEQIRVTVTSDVATRARITIGAHTEDVNLVPGVNAITLAGAPRTWTTGATARSSTHTVRIQPLDAAGALTGTAVDAGSVVIRRAGGGTRPTAVRPPRL